MPLAARRIATPTHVARLTALGIAFAGAGLFAVARPALETPVAERAPQIAIVDSVNVPLVVAVATQTEAPPIAAASARSLSLVFTAQGATYMKLELLAVPGERTDMDGVSRPSIPHHSKPKLTNENYLEISIATVAEADAPRVHRDRIGEKVTVDGTCTATITGFAVVGRLSGSPGYAGDDTTERWTATNVIRYGAPMLAAKLDGCNGTLARAAELPAPEVPEVRTITSTARAGEDQAVVAAARTALLSSKAARAATKEWREHDPDSEWNTSPATTWRVQVLRHPTTGEKFVSVHASQMEGCGTPHVNVWGLYRANPDGTITALDVDLGEIMTIEALVDVDGDGAFEVIGAPWLGGRLVNDLHGTTLEKLDEPFYGCPC